MSRATERERAKKLHAVEAGPLIKSSLPLVFEKMTAAEIDKVQWVFDMYVINEELKKEADELYRKAQVVKNDNLADARKLYQKAEELMGSRTEVRESDKALRLDHEKLLAPDAFKAKTDNIDEAAYLRKVKEALANKGVWLRFAQKMVQDPQEKSRRYVDATHFEVWLSYGYDGAWFPTSTGRLDRATILGNTTLGAGYYSKVFKGMVQKTLEKAVNRVNQLIDDGLAYHSWVWRERNVRATPGVPWVSDVLGGADYPDEKIWDTPTALLREALHLNVGGNVRKSSLCVVAAALTAGKDAKLISDYVTAATKGRDRAVKVLTVLDWAGKIAGVVLIVYSVAVGLVRFLAVEGAEGGVGVAEGVGRGKAPRPPVNPEGQTVYRGPEAYEDTLARAGEGLNTENTGARVTVYDLAEQNRQNAWLDEFDRYLDAAAANGNGAIPADQVWQFVERVDARWGSYIPGEEYVPHP